ncbi:hypothetical protein ACFWTE_02735 [Nocardiopsis sp. NPDC058631]|uniref:hypothetical protein n=1 Tax=Nocardiopsis sp. NPDC058631 TaxID=3346566 RepID=UPI0036463902
MTPATGPDDDAREDVRRLDGGTMNTVFRHGRVVRTATPASPALHTHLRALADTGYRGAPFPPEERWSAPRRHSYKTGACRPMHHRSHD